MSVSRTVDIDATSQISFEDAIKKGFTRATRTLRNISRFEVNKWQADIKDQAIERYVVSLRITFVIDDTL